MTINPEEVKLFESQRLTDTDDGGGRATGNVVEDGKVNNLFPDISRLNRTIGNVSLRKGFVGVDTNNADVYLGAHAIITKPPADPLVNTLIFDAGSESDTRDSAKNRIEAYTVKGGRAQWELIGNQYENQRQLVAVQREEVGLPATGDVFVLKDGTNEQYVRLTEVEHEIATFAYASGSSFIDFTRRRMVLSISAPLEFTFPGGEVTPAGTTGTKSDVFGTEVADAARYWGVKPTALAAAISDLTVKVDSIFANLVPSAQTESPLLDQPLGYDKLTVISATASDRTEAITAVYTSSTNLQVFIGRAAVPQSAALSIGGSAYADDGSGTLTRSSGSFPFATLTIDYDSGAIFGTRDSGTGSGTVTGSCTYRPGAALTGRTTNTSIGVTLSNRGINWIENFAAEKPRPGTMVVSYMVLGKWYELRDNGTGQLQGSGIGSIDFVSGTTLVTLEALPDVGSSIIFSFLMDIEEEYATHEGVIADGLPEIELQLEEAVVSNTLSIDYTSGGTLKNIGDDGNGGLTGDATGSIDYPTGVVRLKPTTLPDDGTVFDATYQAGNAITEGHETEANGTLTGVLDNAPAMPGSVSVRLWIDDTKSGQSGSYVTVTDNGSGGWNGATGSINYATGAWTITKSNTYTYDVRKYSQFGTMDPATGRFTRDSFDTTFSAANIARSAAITYRENGDPAAAQALNGYSPNSLILNLLETGDDALVSGSILFDFAGETYFDRNGLLYKQLDSKTGAGTAVGAVNYATRTATLDTWTGGASPGVTIHSMLTVSMAVLNTSFIFRTPGAPIRPTSLGILATDVDGNIISSNADTDGNFIGPSIAGNVNYDTGIVQVQFTSNAADETGASDIPVQPDATYSVVLYSYLPLDADQIGLDPVRLPSDGRVPIYREGDVIVISHTAEQPEGVPASDDVVDVGRTYVARIWVEDANGGQLDPSQYEVDLETGILTFGPALVMQDILTNPLTAPYKVKDRIEHMTVVNDVEITGEVSFNTPLAHDYPAEETVVSSALVWNDLFSRVYSMFTQKSWDSGSPNWTESRQGDDTTAQYNNIDNPIEYTNNGAITEKWALWFYSSTSFYIVGSELGVIGQGNTSGDCAPMNPNTGNPYFVIRAAGWGINWSSNNVLRFNTQGCLGPLWIARTVLTGAATEVDDEFTLQLRGDAD